MIKPALRLAVSILLSLQPLVAAAALHEAPSASAARTAAAASTAAGPAAGMTGVEAATWLQNADAASIGALAAQPEAAAAFAGALSAAPQALDAAAKTIAARAAADPAFAAAVAQLREASAAHTSAKARAAFERVAGAAGSWKQAIDDSGSIPGREGGRISGAALSKYSPRSVGGKLRAAVAGLAMLTGIAAAPGIGAAQTAHPWHDAAVAAQGHVVLAQARVGSEQYVQGSDFNDVLRKFDPAKRVYILGNVDEQVWRDSGLWKKIEDAATYLADKDMVLLVVQDASNLHLRTGNGDQYGLDAVEYFTGGGLYAKIDPIARKNAHNGRSQGSVLTVVVTQRKTYFRGSEAMRAEGLAVDPSQLAQFPGRRWNNDLENLARPGLRSQFNFYQAAMEVVGGLDRLTQQSIDRKLDVVKDADAAVKKLAQAQADFLKKHPKAMLTDISAMTKKLDAANAFIAAKQLDKAVAAVNGLGSEASTALSSIGSFDRMLGDAKRRVADAKTAVEALATAQAEFAKKHEKAKLSDVAAMRRAIAQAETFLGEDNPGAAAQAVSGLEKQAVEAREAFASFDSAFKDATQQIARAETELGAYKKANASATGDVVTKADIRGFREKLASSESTLGTSPTASLATLRGIIRDAGSAADALKSFPGKFSEIRQMEERRAKMAADSYADSASEQLLAAKQALEQAAREHGNGSSAYANYVRDASQKLDEAEPIIAKAAADAAWWFNLWVALAGLVTLGGLGIGAYLYRRSSKARKKALAALEAWDKALTEKQDGIQDYVNNLLKDNISDSWTGKTLELSKQAERDARRAKILMGVTEYAHNHVKGLIEPATFMGKVKNTFTTGNYAAAERQLADEPITWDPQSDGDLKKIFGENKDEWKKVTDDMKSYGAISMSVNQVIAKFNELMNAAKPSLETIQKARTDGPGSIAKAEQTIAEAGKLRETLKNADGQFQGTGLFEAALPAASALVEKSKETFKTDPVTGIDGQAAEAARIVADVQAFAAAVTAARAGSLADAAKSSETLAAMQVGNSWIAAFRAGMSAASDQVARQAATSSIAQYVQSLTESAAELARHAADAVAGAKALAELTDRMQKGTAVIEDARQKIGAKLQIPAEKTMTEKDSNPSDFMAAAAQAAARAKTALDAGKLDEAKKAYDEIANAVNAASQITAQSMKSLESHEATAETRRAETERLKGLVAEHQRVLDSIRKDFAPSVLKLGAGDPSHPGADGTVDNNIEEAEAAIDAAAARRDKAMKAFREGRVLEAANLLSQAQAHQEITTYRFAEITEKRANLDKAVAANAAKADALKAKIKAYDTEIDADKRTMKATLKEFADVKAQVAKAAALLDVKKGDPFDTAKQLEAAQKAVEHVSNAAQNDRDSFAELQRGIETARKQIDEADRTMRQTLDNGVGESQTLHAAIQEILGYEKRYKELVEDAKASHGDWPKLGQDADQIGRRASKAAASVRGELEAAKQASWRIEEANRKVHEATGWRGHYGVSVPGSPGSGELNSARHALSNGDYGSAVRYAEAAASAAAQAIAYAEAEVARRRRAEEEEEERRRAEARRRQQEEEDRRRRSEDNSSSWSGGGSSGGGWSSGGSSGSDSGGFSGGGSGADSGSF